MIGIKNIEYDYRKGKIISNPLTRFLYNKMANNPNIHDMIIKDEDKYDLTDLINDIIIRYEESYWHKIPIFMFSRKRVTVNKINKLLKRREIPFEIKLFNNKTIEDHYALEYIGVYSQLDLQYSDYTLISDLDMIYLIFDKAYHCSPLSQGNMIKLSKMLKDLKFHDMNIPCYYGDLDDIAGINKLLEKLGFPFVINQKIYMGNKIYEIIRTDKI